MKKKLLHSIWFGLLISGCSQEEIQNNLSMNPKLPIVEAGFEQAKSRTHIEEGKYLRWDKDDQISFFYKSTLNLQYLFDGDTGDNAGTFSPTNQVVGTGNDLDCNYAVYPYNSDAKISEGGIITTTLPSVQNYAENSFGLGANTMVAATQSTDDTFLKFKNVGGYLKLQLFGNDVTIKSITLTGNNNEKLAGEASITPIYDQDPTINMADDATTETTLDCEEGVKIGSTAETATTFWMVVPPTTFNDGFTITITDINEGEFTKTTSKTIKIERNVIQPMAAFEVQPQKKIDNTPYLTFSATGSQSLTMTKEVPTLEYTKDGKTWEPLGTNKVTFGGEDGVLKLRGQSEKGTASAEEPWEDYAKIVFEETDVRVVCSGDIRTLIDYKNYTTVTTSNACFYQLFLYCYQLTSAPKLPATDLAINCYWGMFNQCTNLTSAPELPATTLAENCYYAMFQGCTNLEEAPELPATTLAKGCYWYMFQGCTKLGQAPELPATTLAENCYASMFADCTNLEETPELSATTLAKNCYASMFANCIALNSVPELLATTLVEGCYSGMFQGCTNLEEAPELPAKTLAENCYYAMFQSCTKLGEAPELPATTLKESCYGSMFQGCTNLEEAPELPATTLAKSCYASMFANCIALNSVPELPATTLAESCYASMFADCTNLEETPELSATTLAKECYSRMFAGCTKLEEAPALPATTLEESCYESMFERCSRLIEPPVLSATTLVERCYAGMFQSCTKLNKVIMLATTIDGDNCLQGWLNDTAYDGTFLKNASMSETTLYNYNNYYKPFQWNVYDYGEYKYTWFHPDRFITYVGNYETYISGNDTYEYSSFIKCPITDDILEIEFKYEMEETPYNVDPVRNNNYLCCTDQYKENKSSIVLTPTALEFKKDEYDSNENDLYQDYSFTWDKLEAQRTTPMTLKVSFKEGYIKLNDKYIKYNFANGGIKSEYLFTYYKRERDDGWYKTQGQGVPKGSKLYYVKIWNSNSELIYLGSASKAVNPATSEEEFCWRSYYNGVEKLEFAYKPKNTSYYKPYGGGVN